jgi:aspartate-semialdehyde dehydrogenase
MKKIPVGVAGATGMVGQQYLRLLADHPWFKVVYLAASKNSAGRKYKQVIAGRWYMNSELPEEIGDIMVNDIDDIKKAAKKCRLIFSAFKMPTDEAVRKLESDYAAAGLAVVSNSSAHRWTPDVPMLIPEINHEHLKIISQQQKHYHWKKGFIVVKPNCSLQSYLLPLYALQQAGYQVKKVIVTTMQAVSGAGYPGVASLDMIDNVVPYIGGEEEKSEQEPLKILGNINKDKIENYKDLKISAHCNRVPVNDGHLACISVLFGRKKSTEQKIINIWKKYISLPQKLKLPSAPLQPIIYRIEENRPQPKKDRDNDKAMAVTVGRLRPCEVLDYKFVGLSHNTIRGAAGGGILNAELLVKKKYLK